MEWISVKDRLPEITGDYLVYLDYNKRIIVAQFNKAESKYGINRGAWSVFDEDIYPFMVSRTKSITHWMPLPEVPKD